jgi:hypothetical protein
MNDISEFVLDDSDKSELRDAPLEKGSLVMLVEPLVLEKAKEEEEDAVDLIDLKASIQEFPVEIPLTTPRVPVEEEKESPEERFASRKAFYVCCADTLREFKRVTDHQKQWQCISSSSSPFLVFTLGNCYMLKTQLPAKLRVERFIRACVDFDPKTRLRWDPDFTHVRVLDDYSDEDGTRVVQWTMRKPPLAFLSRHPPSGISVLHWSVRERYVVATHIAAHTKADSQMPNLVKGWAAFYIGEHNALIAVFETHCPDMPGYAAYYVNMLQERITLMEGVCSDKWNYYYA